MHPALRWNGRNRPEDGGLGGFPSRSERTAGPSLAAPIRPSPRRHNGDPDVRERRTAPGGRMLGLGWFRMLPSLRPLIAVRGQGRSCTPACGPLSLCRHDGWRAFSASTPSQGGAERVERCPCMLRKTDRRPELRLAWGFTTWSVLSEGCVKRPKEKLHGSDYPPSFYCSSSRTRTGPGPRSRPDRRSGAGRRPG